MTKWIVDNLSKVLTVGLFVALLIGLFAMSKCHSSDQRAGAAVRQTGAATASGQDAVAVVGNREDADAATDAVTRENADAIRNAEGSDALVAPASHSTGLAGLCRRVSYAHSARCKAAE